MIQERTVIGFGTKAGKIDDLGSPKPFGRHCSFYSGFVINRRPMTSYLSVVSTLRTVYLYTMIGTLLAGATIFSFEQSTTWTRVFSPSSLVPALRPSPCAFFVVVEPRVAFVNALFRENYFT